jgi:hypothetical protein
VGLSPLGTAATSGLLYKPQMIDEDDCGAIGGMKIGRGNRGTRRKPAPAPLCPPQIPHDQTRARTPGCRGGKPATNRLSYGAANSYISIYSLPLTSTGRSLAYIYKPKTCYSVLMYKSLLLVITNRTTRRQWEAPVFQSAVQSRPLPKTMSDVGSVYTQCNRRWMRSYLWEL